MNRNRIKTATGWQWITIPVKGREHHYSMNRVEIDYHSEWQNDHWRALEYNYAKTPHFKEYADFFKNVYDRHWELLADLDIYLIEQVMNILGIKVPVERSSSFNVSGKATELLINICKNVRADTYLSGEGGRRYMDLGRFQEEDIEVQFQEFHHPIYPQQFDKEGFVPQMSIIDLLFNCGKDSMSIIKDTKKI